jgi:hypothetical protein
MTGAFLFTRFILNKMQFLPSLEFPGLSSAHKVEFLINGTMLWPTHHPKESFSFANFWPAVQ